MVEGSRGPKKARGASFLLYPLLARRLRLSLLGLFPARPLLSALSLFLVLHRFHGSHPQILFAQDPSVAFVLTTE